VEIVSVGVEIVSVGVEIITGGVEIVGGGEEESIFEHITPNGVRNYGCHDSTNISLLTE